MNFKLFKAAVADRFARMAKTDLFRTDTTKEELWATYLGSFPEGTNPIHEKRTEYDCSCCRNFISAVGNVVSFTDGKLMSVWDTEISEPAFQAVADAMSAYVKSKRISRPFLHYEKTAGTDRNFEDTVNGVREWNHFFVHLPNHFVMKGADIDSSIGESVATHDVLARGLAELTDSALETVLELAAQNTLYRGAENASAVSKFRDVLAQYKKVPKDSQDLFVWSQSKKLPVSVSRIRNTAIGSLLIDLSEGKELDAAVKSFEDKVAPANYKRPTAVVTKAMVDKAKATIVSLGLTSALERRYATLPDVSVNNVLFVDRSARKSMNSNVFDEISAAVPERSDRVSARVEEISIDKFIQDILPRVDSIELLVENSHIPNLVSLVAPVDPTSRDLFKWGNKFSWSYNGEFADSIKERVKKAGGNVSGDLCCRLAWFNHDDLDFHIVEPSGYELYFANRHTLSPSGGRLDVDMNAGMGHTRSPVENIFYASQRTMQEGTYRLGVYNFSQRESIDVGFEAEIDFCGQTWKMAHPFGLRNKAGIGIATFSYSKATGIKMLESLPVSQSVKQVWGISTSTYQKVNVLMLSPNFWDGQEVGNKHYFFMLDGCQNEGQARGFYNEFLTNDLNEHRKVIEVVGSKMKTENSSNQLSGLGFSSTQRNSVMCRVKGAFSRIIKITF